MKRKAPEVAGRCVGANGEDGLLMKSLAKGKKQLEGLETIDLDTDTLRARMRGALGQMIDDPEAAKQILRTKRARREWSRQLRPFAEKLESAAANLAKAAVYFETNPLHPEEPSGFAYNIRGIVQSLRDKATEARRDADELEKL